MLVAAVLLLVGVIAGLLRGGRLGNISNVHFRHPWLVFVGLGLQVGAQALSRSVPAIQHGSAGPVIVGVSYAFVVAFVALNWRFPGTVFIGLGLLLNVVVIVSNGAMPVSLSALRAVGITSLPGLQTGLKHHVMDHTTRFRALGDILPLPALGIVSLGDCVLGVGVMLLVYRLVSYSPRRLLNMAGQGSGLPGRAAPEPPTAAAQPDEPPTAAAQPVPEPPTAAAQPVPEPPTTAAQPDELVTAETPAAAPECPEPPTTPD